MNFPLSFGRRLIALRERFRLSQVALERRLGFPRGTLSRWETGQRVPAPEQLSALALAFGIPSEELKAGTDLDCSMPETPWWARAAGFPLPWIRPEHTMETRFPAILSAYPRMARDAVARIAQGPHAAAIGNLFRDWWLDSALEGLFALRLAAERGGLPAWVPPGFRLHQVICHFKERNAVDRPHPCLITPDRQVWFPQVSIWLKGWKQRPDCLVWQPPGIWSNVEIDGDGHRGSNDEQRDKDLMIPVLRLEKADVLSRGLWSKVDEFMR